MRINPDSETAHVVLTLVEGDVMTPIRLTKEQAGIVRRNLLGLYGAHSKQPANMELQDGRKFHFHHTIWTPMLELLNKWYDDTHPAR